MPERAPGTLVAADLDAVVFDFHGTLAVGPGFTYDIALGTVLETLRDGGVRVDADAFERAYSEQVRAYFEQRLATGDEQHNTLWVARALTEIGVPASPEDPPVRAAVTAYFARYEREFRLLPGARELLEALSGRFRLGLLSNFTDPRPVRGVLRREGLDRHLDATVISAETGRCKPQADVFAHVVSALRASPSRTLHVGDDPRDDVGGATAAGLRAAWLRGSEPAPLRRWVGGDPVLERARADWVVSELSELQALLSS